MFHKHTWKEIARTYAEPHVGTVNVERGGTQELLERMAFGVTTILWECQDPGCKKLRREELLGKEVGSG